MSGGRGWVVSGSVGTMTAPGGNGADGVEGGIEDCGRPTRRIVSSTGGPSSGGMEPPRGTGGGSISCRAREPLLVAGPIGIGRGISRLRGCSVVGGGCDPAGGLDGGGDDAGGGADVSGGGLGVETGGGGVGTGGCGVETGGGVVETGGCGVETGGGDVEAGGGAGVGADGGAATGHGANVADGTNTTCPDGSCQFVPSLTNCTLRLPSGRPGGHWTFWPRCTHLHACANACEAASATTRAINSTDQRVRRIDTKPPFVCEPRASRPG